MKKLILTFSTTSLFIFFYLLKEQIYMLTKCPPIVNIILYLLIVFFLAGLSLLLIRLSGKKSKETLNGILEIEYADNIFLPVYLGYFFVALSLPSVDNAGWLIFSVTYVVIFLFTFFSGTIYYNPLFLLFGYQFYIVKNKDNVKIGLITQKPLKQTVTNKMSIYRVTDYVFLAKKDKEGETE